MSEQGGERRKQIGKGTRGEQKMREECSLLRQSPDEAENRVVETQEKRLKSENFREH